VGVVGKQKKPLQNRQGLAVHFRILNGFVGDQAAGKTLLLDFGDIAPGAAQTGRWNMTASLAGQFVEFNATFTHADALGGALTSLIRQVNTHEPIRDVLVELPGRDTVRDFMAPRSRCGIRARAVPPARPMPGHTRRVLRRTHTGRCLT